MQEIIKNNIRVENMIYEIGEKQIMMDSDLAKLYQVETKRINEAVRNNPNKFPTRFSWILTEKEWVSLRSKISTLNGSQIGRGQHRKYLPRVFTEQGVAMLATILKSSVATEVSINIMDAFVLMRKYISTNLLEQKCINNMVLDHEERLKMVEDTFSRFKEVNNHLFFEGQIYDAHSLLIDILKKGQKEIIIIDNYIDKEVLDILKKINTKTIIITNKYNNIDYQKYKKQYHNIIMKINNSFHDRFIVLDRKLVYHSGASFKDLGKKCFAITKIEEKGILEKIINLL
ncbi:MAG: ORF6N domain-containing protein [Bacilli bacterium]|nr:ORF6N domain-containing protein [Bacilli bacterium]